MQSQAKGPTLKRTLRASIVITALALTFGPGTTPAWAEETQDANTQLTSVRHYLTTDQLQRFSLDALDVGESQPVRPDEFKTYGYYPGGLNGAEARFCTQPGNWGKCASATSAADDALAGSQAKFDRDSPNQGKGDAYRHCYWSARMTIDMGAGEAQGFGDRHEAGSSGRDKEMDLANSATGRSVGQSYRTYDSASNRCEWLARNDRLVTLR